MDLAGRPLDDWQSDSIDLILATRGDGHWACFEYCEWVPRQNGKGTVLEARALAGFFLLGEALIMWSAHEYKTAMVAFRRVRGLMRALGRQVGDNENLLEFDKLDENGEPTTFLVKINNTNGEEGFERLDTEAQIKFLARSKGSGRGFTGNCNIIDEAFALTVDQHQALLYTVSAIPNAQIIYTSSPPLTGDTGAVMYSLRHRGDPTAPRVDDDGPWEQDPSLGYRDFGIAGNLDFLDGVDLEDLANWAAANPSLGILRSNGTGLTHEAVGRELRAAKADLPGWARERLGIWPRQADDRSPRWEVIGESTWLTRLDRQAVMGDPLTLAVDVTPDRTWAAISAAGPRTGGGRVVDVIDHRPGTGWIIDRLVELAVKHKPLVIVISDKAIADAAGGTELPDGTKLRVIRAGAADMAASAAAFFDAVAGTAPDLWQLGQPSLTTAVSGATKRTIGDGWAWNRRSITTDICPLVASSLALWALGTVRLHVAASTPFAMT
ncbi:hypothetical protein [Micromonospora haikouensis]|uniref:hypothetical protein n=1 Tax=Micromonospora haikouensis TaxID=686309 RepID=UPI003D70E8AC